MASADPITEFQHAVERAVRPETRRHAIEPRDDPVAAVDNSCVGCGNCGEVADAAVLCPSFFRADVVHNPNAFDTWRQRMTMKFIGWLQARRERAGAAA
jgi:hypothetical protein